MTNQSTLAFLEKLADAVPRAIGGAGVGPTSCILSTKAIVEACRAKGIMAKPIPVKLRVLSPGMVEAIEAGTFEGMSKAEMRAACAYSVEIGHQPAGGDGWDGHLVALVKNRWLVDAAIEQVNRPAKGIKTVPFVTDVTPGFLKGEPLGVVHDNGTMAIYDYDPNNTAFLTAPSWTQYRYVDGKDGQFRLDRIRPQPGRATRVEGLVS